MKNKILVVDDEKNIVDPIVYALQREGYRTEAAYNGKEALEKIAYFQPEIIILDIMMPEMNGFEVCRRLENLNELGVILLTAKEDIVDKVLGLELGADDYITKPFDIRELIARVNSLLRRLEKRSSEEQEEIRIKDLKITLNQRKVQIKETVLELTPKEFDLLVLLLSNIGRVYTREQLLDLVWGMDYAGGTRTVDIHIQRLRKKLGGSYGEVLQTVHGIGYKALGVFYEE